MSFINKILLYVFMWAGARLFNYLAVETSDEDDIGENVISVMFSMHMPRVWNDNVVVMMNKKLEEDE